MLMTPEAIRELVARDFPELTEVRRESPNGWAFYLGAKVDGPKPNRIFRVLHSGVGTSKVKLAVTSRITSDFEFTFCGDKAELKLLVLREMSLFKTHFEGK
jgi:hypothetical protein